MPCFLYLTMAAVLLFHRSCLALLGTQWKFFRKLPPTFSRESRTAP